MPELRAKYLPASVQEYSERVAFVGLAGCVSLGLVSIAASQVLLALAIVGFLWMLKRHSGSYAPEMSIILPLLAFMIWTMVAIFAAPNVTLALTGSRKLYLLLIVVIVPSILCGKGRLTWIYRAIFAVAVVSSLAGIVQFAADPHRDLLHRISGFVSHWMTYSGLLMLVLVLLAAYALYAGIRRNIWVIPVVAFVILALVLSQTRSSMVGAIVGIMVLFLFRRPRAIIILLAAVLLFFALSPASIKQRFRSGFDLADPNTRNRIELFQTSMRLIRDNPWLGVGPKNVSYEALKYRGKNEFPDWMYQHMHNNFFQIAAEIGIPGLLIWLWLMLRFAWDALRRYRYANGPHFSGEESLRQEALIASSAALAAWVAFMIAGMFEYNFGDSEVLTLFLFIASAHYAFKTPLKALPRSENQRLTIAASE